MFESIRTAIKQARFKRFEKGHAFASMFPEVEVSRRPLRVMLVCTMLLLALTNGRAQSGGATGTIVGTVVDSTGALIAGAQVSIIESDTNVSMQTTTSSSGSYTVASLKPGTYHVTAAAKGFETTTVSNVVLVVGSEQRVDFKLAPGSEQQTVNVNAEAVGLDTENAAIGQVVTGEEIVDFL